MPRDRNIPLAAAVAAALCILSVSPPASSADVDRGRALYELRCVSCHADSVHGRAKRVARDFEDVRLWVGRWNQSLDLRWKDDELDDVAVHLNMTYYRYSCPPRVCKVVSLAPGSNSFSRGPGR